MGLGVDRLSETFDFSEKHNFNSVPTERKFVVIIEYCLIFVAG